MIIHRTPLERYLGAIALPDDGTDCILWTGGTGSGGYGIVSLGKADLQVKAHRFIYEHAVGPIPKDYVIHHICKNISCVNPSHLECLQENVHRSLKDPPRKTHCLKGHEYTEDNIYWQPPHPASGQNKQGMVCRQCRREKEKARREEGRSPDWISMRGRWPRKKEQLCGSG